MKKVLIIVFNLFLILPVYSENKSEDTLPGTNNCEKVMKYGDSVRLGRPFAKDPYVIWFQSHYLMYYSVKGYTDMNNVSHGLGIGIAESTDLINWTRIGEINKNKTATYEANGFGAPCALVIDNKVHLFYQTYGNGIKDAICHAWSSDGVFFTRDSTNPIFHPEGSWNCGRAIDAEVIKFSGKYYLYFATRNPANQIQMLGVAVAPGNTNFNRQDWAHVSTEGSILKPELPWEKTCIEAPSVIVHNGELFMFYAGAYNNAPQQIGVARSRDGIHWSRISDEPFLPNGKEGQWNSSESEHPDIFVGTDGKTFLFYQGNNNNGETWYISNIEVFWNEDGLPYLK